MDITTADAPEQGAGRDGSSRRRLVTAGLTGAALAALVARPAAAAADETTTTTTPPKHPTSADVELLVFAQGAELAALELYHRALAADEAAIAAGTTDGLLFDDADRATMASIRQHHDAYAEALGGLLGRDSIIGFDTTIVDALAAQFESADAATIAQGAHELEKTLVATHTALLGELDGLDGTGIIASIAVVEARHVTVLAHLAGLMPASDLDAFIGANDATPLSPA